MRKFFYGMAEWLLNLFDPPPLAKMTQTQKVGRVLLLSITLVVGSVILAMLGAVGMYLVEKGTEFRNSPEFYAGICIVFIGVVVNSACLLALVLVRRADTKLIPPTQGGSAMAKSEMEGQ